KDEMSMNKPILLKGIQIYSEESMLENGYIKIQNQEIIDFGSMKELIQEDQSEIIEIPPGYKAVPGFIDVHIHGVNGADVMDATEDALTIMSEALPGEGTTSFLATTMTQSNADIEKAIENTGNYMDRKQEPGKAEILGIHLEGPFVNAKRAGAQPAEHIVDPDLTAFKKW